MLVQTIVECDSKFVKNQNKKMKTKDIGLLVSYEENNYSKYCIEKGGKKMC